MPESLRTAAPGRRPSPGYRPRPTPLTAPQPGPAASEQRTAVLTTDGPTDAATPVAIDAAAPVAPAAIDTGVSASIDAVEPVGRLRGWVTWLRGAPGFAQVAAISASLVGTQAVTSLLGLVYWAVAARQSSVAAVGIAGAAVSLMLLLGGVGMLGLGTLIMAELPKLPGPQRRVFVRSSLVTAATASVVVGAAVALGIGLLGSSNLGTLAVPFNVVDFAIGTGLTGMTMVLDQAVLVVDRSRVQLERNTVASVVKIVALVLLALAGHTDGMDIFLAWTIGNAVSMVLVAGRLRATPALRAGGTRAARSIRARFGDEKLIDIGLMRRMARSAASHHALNLMLQAPLLLLSVVVALVLSAVDNGYFSTARSITGFVFVLPFSITIALFAAAKGRESELTQRMKFTIPFGIAASLAADIVLFPFGSLVLSVFGHNYSVEALTTLRVLVLAGIPFVIKDHFVALRRVQNRTGNAALVALAGAVFELVAAYTGAKIGGTVGLCALWVGALVIEAILLSGPLWRAMRRSTGSVTAGPTPPGTGVLEPDEPLELDQRVLVAADTASGASE